MNPESALPTIGTIPANLPSDPATSFPGCLIPNNAVAAVLALVAIVFNSSIGSFPPPPPAPPAPAPPPPILPPPSAKTTPSRTASFIDSIASPPSFSSIVMKKILQNMRI